MNYIINGKSFNLINDEIKKIVKNNDNLIYFNMDECNIYNVLEEASFISLFDDIKYIVIKNCTLFKSSLSEKLEKEYNSLIKYLENPNKNTELIFILEDKIDDRKKLGKLFKNTYKIIEVKDLDNNKLHKKIEDMFKIKGIDINFQCRELIIERGLKNYDLILSEINKLLVYFDDVKNVDINKLDELLIRTVTDNVYDFTNSLIKRDYSKAQMYLNDLRTMKVETEDIVGALSSSYRMMYLVKNMLNDGYKEKDIVDLFKVHPYSISCSISNSYNYSNIDLENIIIKLSDMDIKMKSNDFNKYLSLELFIIFIMCL